MTVHDHMTSERDACLNACFECLTACARCLDACAGHQGMARCIQNCRDVIEIATVCIKLLPTESRMAREACRLCALACDECADECGRHNHDHCRDCAKACRTCAQECRSVA
jgi:hypothetical protein